jgi:hypothetical protein
MRGDGLTDPVQMDARAREHAGLGGVLFEAGHEWAAVAWFYSAYHMVKAAFIRDPIFDDYDRLSRLNSKLRPEDRYEIRHSYGGGLSGTQYGVDELVWFLYRPIASDYKLLRMRSCDVRYRNGLSRPDDLQGIRQSFAKVHAAYKAQDLVCPAP